LEIKKRMVAIITGDIIHSAKVNPKKWLVKLKSALHTIGKSPATWQIYRGDSFQLIIKDPQDALSFAILIKATLRSVHPLDVRMAIGIGEISHRAAKITESNGTAFVHSGEKFESLKMEKQNLALQSPWPDFDDEINILLRLGLIAMDNWTVPSAEMVCDVLLIPGISQEELGRRAGIRQSAVSRRLKRACFDEINALINRYKTQLNRRT
jgi:hypothetical protein